MKPDSSPTNRPGDWSEYWKGRWDRRETGWHQAEVEPNLISQFAGLAPTRVFVPLCGKSLDVAWLARQGHEVIGVELAEQAVREFFSENGLSPEVEQAGELRRYSAGGVTIFNGDYFALKPEQLGRLGAVYDRAALIALPSDLRSRYATRMTELLAPSRAQGAIHFVQIVIERKPHDDLGPPFSIPARELEALYGRAFKIEEVSREPVELKNPVPHPADECVYRLK